MQEMTDVIRPFANGKIVGPDGVSVGCSISPSKVIPPCNKRCTVSSFAFEGGGGAFPICVLLTPVAVSG